MNWESDTPDGFSEADRAFALESAEVASQLAKLATVRGALAQGMLGGQQGLENLVREVKREFDFDQVHVFVADEIEGLLDLRAPQDHKFSHRFSDVAVATKVFFEGQYYYSSHPEKDLFVSKDATKRFRVKGPIIGIPLRFSTVTIGAIVASAGPLWLDQRDPLPVEDSRLKKIVTTLETFVSQYISGAFAHRSISGTAALRKLQSGLGCHQSETELVRSVLETIRGFGFDRVRIFRLVDVDVELKHASWKCLGSLGVDADDKFKGATIGWCHQVDFCPAGCSPIREARRFDPSDLDVPVDPNAERLGKTNDLPYANVPIWRGERLYGCIACDNLKFRSWITRAQLDLLELTADVIAPEFVHRFFPAEHRAIR